MKRKVQKKAKDDTSYLLDKIDEALTALDKNEDELSNVLTELINRDLSAEECTSIKKLYSSYSKSVEMVKKTMEN